MEIKSITTEVEAIVTGVFKDYCDVHGDRLLDQLRSRIKRTEIGYLRVHGEAVTRVSEHMRKFEFAYIRDTAFEAIDDMIRAGADDGTELRRQALVAINAMIDHCAHEFADKI